MPKVRVEDKQFATRLGRVLVELRGQSGETRDEAAERMEVNAGTLGREQGKPVVVAEITSLFITTNLNNGPNAQETAAEMCVDIAAAPYDDNAELIGWLHVHVGSRTHEELADCDVVY